LPPFFAPGRSNDGILPTPDFSTALPSPPSPRRSGSSLRRSGFPWKASFTTVCHSASPTLGAHPLSFSPLPHPLLPSSSPHLSPVLATLIFLIYSSPLCPRFSHSFSFSSASTCCPLSPTLGSHQDGEMMIESPEYPVPKDVYQALLGGYGTQGPVPTIWGFPGHGAHTAPSSARFKRSYGAVPYKTKSGGSKNGREKSGNLEGEG